MERELSIIVQDHRFPRDRAQWLQRQVFSFLFPSSCLPSKKKLFSVCFCYINFSYCQILKEYVIHLAHHWEEKNQKSYGCMCAITTSLLPDVLGLLCCSPPIVGLGLGLVLCRLSTKYYQLSNTTSGLALLSPRHRGMLMHFNVPFPRTLPSRQSGSLSVSSIQSLGCVCASLTTWSTHGLTSPNRSGCRCDLFLPSRKSSWWFPRPSLVYGLPANSRLCIILSSKLSFPT